MAAFALTARRSNAVCEQQQGFSQTQALGVPGRTAADRSLTRPDDPGRSIKAVSAHGATPEAENSRAQDRDHRTHRAVCRPQNGTPRTSHWPTGELTQVGKVKPSDCDVWLSRYSFGSASRNLYIGCLKERFALAVRDRVIVTSPAAHLKSVKREKPIRLTPSFEQFKAIIADVRAQQFNADAQDSADFLEFLGLAGLGQAEGGSLARTDIDFEGQRIITFRHKTATGFAVPLFPQLRPLLERLCHGKAHDERVFRIADAKKSLAGACRRLGYPLFSQRLRR